MSDAAARLSDTLDILDRLVGFPSLPGQSNIDLLGFVAETLGALGVDCEIDLHADGQRGNLTALIGPAQPGGVMLNGHTDVVPVDGQIWTSDPFRLRVEGERAFGRGAVDMKGFLACLLAAAPTFHAAALKRPVIYALTFDEEIGGEGAGLLAERLERDPLKPGLCIVGEPTELAIVGGCKGGYEMRTEFTGLATHACDPRLGSNAIYAAARFVAEIERLAARYAERPAAGSLFDPPYTTLNVGRVVGGSARNAVPDSCAIDWEIRPLSPGDGPAILATLEETLARDILPDLRARFPEAEARMVVEAAVPPLEPPAEGDPALALARAMTGRDAPECVSFGTDAGYFQRVGIPTIICGAGSIATAHKPDEFIAVSALAEQLAFFDRLAAQLAV